ncbi:UDP-glucose 4-epimerase [Anaerocolumna cellulosilytica]|uniref:UDP-glucose 4-epimerase n=1 Tax=Anaerocolumna cellulosilytica TaxID=433286 RepID=A0A6S6QNN0_9FIRM|nr:NAD-dependent epimerase/dehydratase family protein [Anaerocolumna cellulosilytica]MBB5195701.1 UDP-glucose 4-epimerase [Anaerocolumna cellulosilytica]BCJ92963.1 UDP-glucose 4-epimerase [Anaerocolumna cellulosilytica]
MKTLVIGGAGFIGSHLNDALLKEGHKVVSVDNLSLGSEINIRHLVSNSNFSFYQQDAADINKLSDIFEKEQPEYVFHLAANSDIQASAKNPEVEYRNTYTTTFNILSCMGKYNVKKLFFSSTSAVYGDKKDIILDENTPNLSPISYYGAAKLGSEALISAFSYMNDFSSLVFRFPNVIGPRLTHGVIYDFIHKLQSNPSELKILGDGKQTKPYIYIADLIQAIIQFMDIDDAGVSIYNLGVEGNTCVTRIADILCEEMGLTNVTYDFTGGKGGWKGDVPKFYYCLDKIHSAGWIARYTSDEAVRKTIIEILNNRKCN